MDWKDVGKALGKVSPLIGSVLGGPAGGAVGTLVASALGVEDDPKSVSQAIKKDPQAAEKIRKLELEAEADIRRFHLNTLEIELKDVQDARKNHQHSKMPAIICVAITIMVACGACLLFTIDIPEDNQEIAYLLFGTLLAKWGDSIAYWVGTTRSSAEKTRIIKNG